MKNWWPLFGLVLTLTTGCIETKQDYTLNPDGSGKVTVASIFQPMNFDSGRGDERP